MGKLVIQKGQRWINKDSGETVTIKTVWDDGWVAVGFPDNTTENLSIEKLVQEYRLSS